MHCTFLFAAAAILLAGSLTANAQKAVTRPTTLGNIACGDWTKQPTESKRAWLAGFLSGANFIWVLENKSGIVDLNWVV